MRAAWLCAFTLAWALSPAYGADPHWIRLRSANFELCTTASPHSALDTIREFEEVRGFFQQAFGGPVDKPLPVRLIAFSSAKEYEPYRFNAFATAYYHGTEDTDYIVMSHAGFDTFPVAVHEYVHLVVRHMGLKLPPWLNEGLAELYSTLHSYQGKILVGDLIPGRYRALQQDQWVPLATILAAGQGSPYYNEKDKAGSLYNEGWALTHMLSFGGGYRANFGKQVHEISGGKDSAAALEDVYGKPVAQVEKDLRLYLRGTTFQGTLVAAKLDQLAGDIPVEPLSEFDTSLMFADLTYRPGKEAEQKAALQRLIELDAKRPEPYRELAYLAWRTGDNAEATVQFGNAFERGDRDSKMLLAYGRFLESAHPEKAAPVFAELLAQDQDNVEVRLELSETYLRSGNTSGAITTLAVLKKISAADSARYFRIAVEADLRTGDRAGAEAAARHFLDLAKTGTDRAAANYLLSMTAPPKPAETPVLRRAETAGEMRRPVARPRLSMSGKFVELDCGGKQARMIVETAAGRKAFLIDDSNNVAIVAQNAGPVDMTCGVQKPALAVDVGYEAPGQEQSGVEGLVRSLKFR